jgi:opacity protein-like surface antigen
MKLSKILLLLLTASSASLALAGGGSYDDSNTSSAATPTAAPANSTSQKEMNLSDGFKGFYITVKGGVPESRDAGEMHGDAGGGEYDIKDSNLGTGHVFGLSVGKRINNNFRLELEFSQRDELEYDAKFTSEPSVSKGVRDKADIDTKSVFINGFYDFESFVISNTSVTPYLGGGIGISRNELGTVTETSTGGTVFIDGDKLSQFAYKFAAGTLVSLTKKLSIDISYQYVDLGRFKSGKNLSNNGVRSALTKEHNGGEIKTQELMIGLQYKF